MAIKASITITISKYRDCDSITRYYKLQASTSAAPAIPTTLNPSGWSTAEPTYTSGSTNTLYYTDCYIFSDGTFQYTDDGNGKAVKSSSYEAAKEAYNKAQAAQDTLDDYLDKQDIIVGTQTAATRFWEGVSQFESLNDGDQIHYWLPYASAYTNAGDRTVGVDMRQNSTTIRTRGTTIITFETGTSTNNVWLNLTLADGTETGWIPCYYGGTSRLTGHYGAGSSIRLTYRVNANVNGVQYTGWFADANYNSDTTDRTRYGNNIKADQMYIRSGRLIGANDNGYIEMTTSCTFRIDKPLLYAGSDIGIISNGNNNYLMYSSSNLINNLTNSRLRNADETITSSTKWYRGNKITGTSTTATIFSGSGISSANVNDYYTNHDTGYVYKCTVAGNASTAKWVYVKNTYAVVGKRWYNGTAITGTSTTATIFSGSGISNAGIGDHYLNTNTGYYYKCTVAGNASTAKWVYSGVLTKINEILYLKGTLNGKYFTTDDVPFTTIVPTYEDGFYYISLGLMYSLSNYGLFPEHPIYKYVNGQFKNISQIAYEAQTNLDNLEIGGRNLLLDSAFPVGTVKWSRNTVDTTVKYMNNNSMRLRLTGGNRLDVPGQYFAAYETGKQLFLTFYIMCQDVSKLTNNIDSWIGFRKDGYVANGVIQRAIQPSELTDNVWKKITIKGSNSDPSNIYCTMMIEPHNSDVDIYIACPKLEYGNKPSDWTPAPEDMNEAIKSVTNLYYSSNSSTPPSKPSAHVTTNNVSTRGQWNIALPTYNEDYPYLYTCKELLNKGGTYSWTTVEQSTYAEAAKEIQDGLESIQADYVTNTMFTSYQRDQVENDQGIKTRLERTEVSIYGELNYELLTAQPSDWSTDYTKYYVIVDNEYVSVSGDSAPTWQPNTYYELPVDPNSLTNKIQQIDNDINGENGLDNRLEIAEDTLDSTGLNELDRRVTITQRFLNVETDVEQIKNIFKITGGNNLIQNSVGYFSSSGNKPSMWNIADNTIYSPFGYDGDLTGVTVSRGKLTCAKGSMVTTQNNIIALITNKVMSISFKYRNGANATSKIKVYNGSIILFEKTFNTTVNEWTDYSFNPDTDPEIANPTFGCPFSSLQISIESTNTANNNGIEISDLMLNYGDVKPWELCNNEVYGAMVKLSSLGIEVTSTTANTKNFMTTDGILVFAYDASTDSIIGSEPITKITDNGTLTNKLESTGDIIERNLINTMITDSSNNDIYVEYIR